MPHDSPRASAPVTRALGRPCGEIDGIQRLPCEDIGRQEEEEGHRLVDAAVLAKVQRRIPARLRTTAVLRPQQTLVRPHLPRTRSAAKRSTLAPVGGAGTTRHLLVELEGCSAALGDSLDTAGLQYEVDSKAGVVVDSWNAVVVDVSSAVMEDHMSASEAGHSSADAVDSRDEHLRGKGILDGLTPKRPTSRTHGLTSSTLKTPQRLNRQTYGATQLHETTTVA